MAQDPSHSGASRTALPGHGGGHRRKARSHGPVEPHRHGATTEMDIAARTIPRPCMPGPMPTGSFVFGNLANTHHRLRVVAEGFAAREDLSVMQLPDGRFRISDGSEGSVIVLEKPASVSGRVIGLDGRPLANALVHFWSYPVHGVPRLGQLVLDEQGRFASGPVMSGDHLVRYGERKQIQGRRSTKASPRSTSSWLPKAGRWRV